jgi:pimeloyl-ACP methyl ester carboxylesterase
VETTAPDGTLIGWDESGSGPPLLLVHGGVADASVWTSVRRLLPEGYRVAAMDRRGRARSGHGSEDGYSLDTEADDVIAVAESLGGSVVIAAHSIGATIALQALRRRGDLFRGAVLYEPPLPGFIAPDAEAEADQMLIAALDEGRNEDALIIFLRDLVKLSEEDIEMSRSSPAWSNRIDLIWTMRRERAGVYSLDPSHERYASIEQPILLLVGTRTPDHHAEAISVLASVLPSSETIVLAGQGHVAVLQAPELVAAAISDFLTKIG